LDETIEALNKKMTTLEEELLLANTKNATLKKDTDAKIKE